MRAKSGDIKTGLIKWFSELNNKSIEIAGGKGASLAEMYNSGFPVPPGFIITAESYRYFTESSGIKDKIQDIISYINVDNTTELEKASQQVRKLIESAELPVDLEEEIRESYNILDADKNIKSAGQGASEILRNSHEPPFVAVRSSATAEDLADASFAGQQDSFLNIKGGNELILKVKECFSSLFTPRAIYYRNKKGFSQDKVYLAVVVQRMIDSEKSGVMFSRNPIKLDNNIVIEAVFGLGEGIVSGRIKPDNYVVDKNLENFRILGEEIAEKKSAIVRDSAGKNKIVKLTEEKSKKKVLNTYEIKMLARYARKLEEHYKKPQDIEFAIEGQEIYIVQSRPITTKAREDRDEEISGEILLSGLGASPGIGSGTVKIVRDLSQLGKVKSGDILVTEMTNPDMVVTMQRAAAIVTDEGGVTSHAAIVSREMGIPAIVGTGNATKKLKDGEIITVDGNNGKVYLGKTESKKAEIKPVVKTKTKIKVILDLPDYAERAAKSGAESVGLTRLEGIIASSGKHPLLYVKEKNINEYISLLVSGLKKICAPFKEVWIRSSDIRSDEFKNLEGSPKEAEGNPMLGNHGVRFSLRHPDILSAELTAIKEIADEFPNKKIGFMVPQVINVAEIAETKRIAREEVGVPKNVKIGIMIETPAAVQIINSLCEEGIDFISFGTNDLTQYTLAIDRNNEFVQYLYDEMNPAVLNSIRYVIKRCKAYGVETSICGQAGSKEEMVRFLLKEGIDSISVNADAAHSVSLLVAQTEGKLPLENRQRDYTKEGDYNGKIDNKDNSYKKVVGENNNKKNEEDVKIKREAPIPMMAMAADEDGESAGNQQNPLGPLAQVPNEDIETIVLRELGEEAADSILGEEYSPNIKDSKEEIPQLNDAIPVDSSNFESEEIKEMVIDTKKEMEEWRGEKKHKKHHSTMESSQTKDEKLDIF